jgi:hypothetical protein
MNLKVRSMPEPVPVPADFSHFGISVPLDPEELKVFHAPLDGMAFRAFFDETKEEHFNRFIKVCRATRNLDPFDVRQAFVNKFLTGDPDNPTPNFQRYEGKCLFQPAPCCADVTPAICLSRCRQVTGCSIWRQLACPIHPDSLSHCSVRRRPIGSTTQIAPLCLPIWFTRRRISTLSLRCLWNSKLRRGGGNSLSRPWRPDNNVPLTSAN